MSPRQIAAKVINKTWTWKEAQEQLRRQCGCKSEYEEFKSWVREYVEIAKRHADAR